MNRKIVTNMKRGNFKTIKSFFSCLLHQNIYLEVHLDESVQQTLRVRNMEYDSENESDLCSIFERLCIECLIVTKMRMITAISFFQVKSTSNVSAFNMN